MEQALGKNIHVDLTFIAIAREENFAVLLKVHEPIWHLQVRHVENLTRLAEGRRVLAVGVDHYDVTVRRVFANAVENERGAGRFTCTGRAKKREVFAQHSIDVETCADVLGREYGANGDVRTAITGIDLFKVPRGRRINHRAGDGIARYTALKAMNSPSELLFGALTQEVDMRDDPVFRPAIFALVANVSKQPCIANPDFDLTTHLACQSDRAITVLHALIEALEIESNLRAGTGYLQHYTDRQSAIILRNTYAPLRLCLLVLHLKSLIPHRIHAGFLASA
jgi:hypothetical protein